MYVFVFLDFCLRVMQIFINIFRNKHEKLKLHKCTINNLYIYHKSHISE